MANREEYTTAWVHKQTRDRINSLKPDDWTADDLIDEALDQFEHRQAIED